MFVRMLTAGLVGGASGCFVFHASLGGKSINCLWFVSIFILFVISTMQYHGPIAFGSESGFLRRGSIGWSSETEADVEIYHVWYVAAGLGASGLGRPSDVSAQSCALCYTQAASAGARSYPSSAQRNSCFGCSSGVHVSGPTVLVYRKRNQFVNPNENDKDALILSIAGKYRRMATTQTSAPPNATPSLLASKLRDYFTLTKPEVNLLILMTTSAGYYLGSEGGFHWGGLVQHADWDFVGRERYGHIEPMDGAGLGWANAADGESLHCPPGGSVRSKPSSSGFDAALRAEFIWH